MTAVEEVAIMRHLDMVSSLFWFMIGTVYCIISLEYGLFDSGMPDAGLLPLIAGLTLTILSITVFINAVKKKNENLKFKFFPEIDSWKKVSVSVLALITYMILMQHLGFIGTTFLFMLFLLIFFSQPRRWIFIIVVSFLTVVSFQIVLVTFLKVQLPRGIFGM